MTRKLEGLRTAADAWSEQWQPRWPPEIAVLEARGDYLNDDGDFVVPVLHPDHPGWVFTLTLASSGVVVGFAVEAAQDLPGGHSQQAPAVTARLLRRLPLGEIEAAVRAYHRQAAAVRSAWTTKELTDRYSRAFADTPRPGRSGRDDRAYAVVAALYVELCNSGSRSPVKDLAAQLGYDESQIRNILHAARSKRRGLLTAAPPGRFGGELTQRALDLLKED